MKILNNNMYLLLVDEEAETCEYYLHNSIDGRHQIYSYKGNEDNFKRGQPIKWCSKIIAYHPLTKEAKELEGLPKLPPFERELDNIKISRRPYLKHKHYCTDEDYEIFSIGFKEGYKAAQAKGQYSLEDMQKAIEMARLMIDNGVEDAFDTESISGLTELCTYGLRDKYSEEEIIQSLSTQQLPKEFILGEGDSIEEQLKNGHYVY